MATYIKKYKTVTEATSDETIISPNVSLIWDGSNKKILKYTSATENEELEIKGSAIGNLEIIKKRFKVRYGATGKLTLAEDIFLDSSDNSVAYSNDFMEGDSTGILIGEERTVIKIKNSAFKDKTALRSLTLPVDIKVIGNECFSGCTSFDTLNYLGTMSEWGAITLGTDWIKDTMIDRVICTDGTISLTTNDQE